MRLRKNEKETAEKVAATNGRPTVLVLDRRGDLASAIAGATETMRPSPEVLRLRRPTEALAATRGSAPDVIVAAPEEVTHAGLRRLAQLHKEHPRSVILLAPNGRASVSIRETAAAGASDFISYPTTPGGIRTKIKEALGVASELRAERVIVHETTTLSGPQATRLGQVMTVTSATGGCGKTFFATNIAAYLSMAGAGRVLLVDLDLQFGEVAHALRLRAGRSIAELVEEEDVAEALSSYVVSHDAGYDVLCAPDDPIAAERVGPREATLVLEAAQAQYDFVVVDTPPALNEVVLAAFDRSRLLVVMATMDVPSLRNLRVFLQTLDRLKLPSEDVSLVLNKAERDAGIEISQIERVYPQGFMAILPYATEVTRSINSGKPVITTSPRSPISSRFIEGATKLVPPMKEGAFSLPGADNDGRRGRMSWLRRLFDRSKKGATE